MIWMDGQFVENEKAMVSVLSHSLHYGGAVYEGIRFYRTGDGRRAVFRLEDHLKRLQASARTMGMETYPVEMLAQATVLAVQLSGLTEGYIRPIVFRGEGIGLMSPSILVHTVIAVLPWAKGPESITLVTSPFVRLHPASTEIVAKVAGHYVNSYLAAAEAKKRGADDALLLDWQGNVAETSVANVFVVKGGKIFTPSRGNVFPGITRATVIDTYWYAYSLALGNDEAYVKEGNITLKDAQEADEMFITGTACEVLPVSRLDNRTFDHRDTVGVFRDMYRKAITGAAFEGLNWLTFVD